MTTSYPYYYDPMPPVAPPPAPPRRPRRRFAYGIGAGIVAAGLVIGGVAIGEARSSISGQGAIAELPTTPTSPSLGGGNTDMNPGTGSGSGTGSGTQNTSSGTQTASAKQQIGIVTIVSVLKYQNAESAGTGMILSSDGEVLTNNHVVNGATSITVTVESTGKSYRADVVGTAPTKDVAVIKLRNASGLSTAALATSSSDVSIGDSVVGVGNAGGTGTLTSASGKVTALEQSITAADETGQDAEKLSGLIQTDAPIISGDSGGPLYDSAGKVVGINTAASANRSATREAYAIPIEDALSVADQIESGVQTATVHIGLPGFIGIGTQDATGGVGVSGVLSGGPAAEAGITAGSVITAIDGKSVSSAEALKSVLSAKDPGSKVAITWTDPQGSKRTATVTLVAGPAD